MWTGARNLWVPVCCKFVIVTACFYKVFKKIHTKKIEKNQQSAVFGLQIYNHRMKFVTCHIVWSIGWALASVWGGGWGFIVVCIILNFDSVVHFPSRFTTTVSTPSVASTEPSLTAPGLSYSTPTTHAWSLQMSRLPVTACTSPYSRSSPPASGRWLRARASHRELCTKPFPRQKPVWSESSFASQTKGGNWI